MNKIPINDDFEFSQVRIKLVDPTGHPIRQLKFQIKQGSTILLQGTTDEQGKLPPLSSRIGAPLSVHVEQFLTRDMKCIRELTPWTETFSIILVSGKIKQEATLAPDKGEAGSYRRKTYLVQAGDTLSSIASRNRCTAKELARLNRIELEAIIHPGQLIKLPVSGTTSAGGTSLAMPAPTGKQSQSENPPSVTPIPNRVGMDSTRSQSNETLPGLPTPLPNTSTSQKRGENGTPKTMTSLSCPGACVKPGDKGSLIEEINVRLTGFGGTVSESTPLNVFTKRTESAIKQFQRDYMGVAETGKICGSLLIALDEFRSKIPISFASMKCRCGQCHGFGNGFIDSQAAGYFKSTDRTKPYAGIEYPGLHRALLWALRAAIYYAESMDTELGFKFLTISSGYRCWHDNKIHKRSTTNHMGNALDIQFSRNNSTTRCSGKDVDILRSNIFVKRIGAQLSWPDKNKLSLETAAEGAKSWVHVDVREYDEQYKAPRYYAVTQDAADGDPLVEVAWREGRLALLCCGGLPPGDTTHHNSSKNGNNGSRLDASSLQISDKGIAFIKAWEKCRLQPYDDSEGFCSIGWGHLIRRQSCDSIRDEADFKEYKNGINQISADQIFLEDIKYTEGIVKSRIQVPLHQHEYDALVSLVFNMGSFRKCPKLLSKLNTKDYNGCCDEFADITNKGTPGLIKRRNCEMKIFRNNLYDTDH